METLKLTTRIPGLGPGLAPQRREPTKISQKHSPVAVQLEGFRPARPTFGAGTLAREWNGPMFNRVFLAHPHSVNETLENQTYGERLRPGAIESPPASRACACMPSVPCSSRPPPPVGGFSRTPRPMVQ